MCIFNSRVDFRNGRGALVTVAESSGRDNGSHDKDKHVCGLLRSILRRTGRVYCGSAVASFVNIDAKLNTICQPPAKVEKKSICNPSAV